MQTAITLFTLTMAPATAAIVADHALSAPAASAVGAYVISFSVIAERATISRQRAGERHRRSGSARAMIGSAQSW